jgi:hypothetical protein
MCEETVNMRTIQMHIGIFPDEGTEAFRNYHRERHSFGEPAILLIANCRIHKQG